MITNLPATATAALRIVAVNAIRSAVSLLELVGALDTAAHPHPCTCGLLSGPHRLDTTPEVPEDPSEDLGPIEALLSRFRHGHEPEGPR
jgi:hypothetical protein